MHRSIPTHSLAAAPTSSCIGKVSPLSRPIAPKPLSRRSHRKCLVCATPSDPQPPSPSSSKPTSSNKRSSHKEFSSLKPVNRKLRSFDEFESDFFSAPAPKDPSTPTAKSPSSLGVLQQDPPNPTPTSTSKPTSTPTSAPPPSPLPSPLLAPPTSSNGSTPPTSAPPAPSESPAAPTSSNGSTSPSPAPPPPPGPHPMPTVSAPALAETTTAPPAPPAKPDIVDPASLAVHISTLKKFHNNGEVDESRRLEAYKAATQLKNILQNAVNSKAKNIRALQTEAMTQGVLAPLLVMAESRVPSAFETMQLLCFRNAMHCDQLVEQGMAQTIANLLPISNTGQRIAEVYLLSAIVAFSDTSHAALINAGLVPQLTAMIRLKPEEMKNKNADPQLGAMQMNAAAVLRNLAHNPTCHTALTQGGALELLVSIMRLVKDPVSRINAAMAVACLVGHEEGNPRLCLEEELVVEMMKTLEASCAGQMRYGIFWTVWKLCQGLASLTVNDKNKELVGANGGVDILMEVLVGKHHNNEAAQRFALSALWNLAFNDTCKSIIIDTPGLVDVIRHVLSNTESIKIREVAKGALWTLGLEQDVKMLHDGTGRHVEGNGAAAGDSDDEEKVEEDPHIMLSYEWGAQQNVMLIKTELERAGYKTWMDIDKMSGSTLEAMAQAVEQSAVVLVCVSKKYKESQACRTEAEYAFQQRKKIVPILMEQNYKATGWLGAIMGTRLYFNMAEHTTISAKVPALMRELGDAGRPGYSARNRQAQQAQVKTVLDTPVMSAARGQDSRSSQLPESWTVLEVEEWLRKIRCGECCATFRDNGIDGIALSGLHRMTTDPSYLHEALTQDLGITQLGQRLRLIEELHRIF